MTLNNPTREAMDYIKYCCQHIGSFTGNYNDVAGFIAQTASKLEVSQPTLLFPERYKEHVGYALHMVSNSYFLSPPAAIASVYLATRFEFYFRVLSGVLKTDGIWISESLRYSVASVRKKPLPKKGISSVALTYKIMKLNQPQQVIPIFAQLDRDLFSTAKGEYMDIGERIEWTRNRAAHGEWGDISAESIFYGLLTAILFYNQT